MFSIIQGLYALGLKEDVKEDEDEEDDGTPSSEGSGAGHVLPPDNLYQEPNEVPIPHHSKRERPDS